MKLKPLISVVMPAYNAEAYIAESIESVQRQTYVDWEIIVVDDGSTDHTSDVVSKLIESEPRIKYFATTNNGPGPARNYGIGKANGQIIAFLDADDLWESTKLADQLVQMEKGPYDLVFSSGRFIGGGPGDQFVSAIGNFTGPEMFTELYPHNRIPTLSVLTTKRALARGGMFKESGNLARHCEDYDLWLRMATAGCSFSGLAKKLVGYRLHPGGASRSLLIMEESELEVIEQFDDQMQQDHPKMVRQRRIELYNRLVIANAAAGRIAQARAYLNKLRGLEPATKVRAKSALLTLSRRRYGGVTRRLHRWPS